MFKKIVYPILITLLALVFSIPASSRVYAAGPAPAAAAEENQANQTGKRVRAMGIVSVVDVAGAAFTITGKQGQTWTFTTADRTQYRGEIASLAELKVGMQAGVGARKVGDQLIAIAVFGRTAPERAAGKVVSVNQALGTFTLAARNGETYTIYTDAETKFRSPDENIQSLADIKPDMLAAVRMVKDAEGHFLAKAVGVKPAK